MREFIVGRDASGTKWTVSVRLGGPTSRLAAVRTWASLTTVDKFADHFGIKGFAIEL